MPRFAVPVRHDFFEFGVRRRPLRLEIARVHPNIRTDFPDLDVGKGFNEFPQGDLAGDSPPSSQVGMEINLYPKMSDQRCQEIRAYRKTLVDFPTGVSVGILANS